METFKPTPLLKATACADEIACRQLIEKGADVDAKESRVIQPLLLAAREGHLGICKLLLDSGANVNIQDLFGNTALMLAAKKGQYDICKLLLERDANPEKIRNGKCRNALYYAMKYQRPLIFGLMRVPSLHKMCARTLGKITPEARAALFTGSSIKISSPRSFRIILKLAIGLNWMIQPFRPQIHTFLKFF